MNLCRLFPIWVTTCTLLGAAISSWLHRGWIIGAAAGMAVGYLPLLLLGVSAGLISLWRPDFAQCLCGRRELRFKGILEPEPVDDHLSEYLYRCPCGMRYAVGTKHVYMIDHQSKRSLYMTQSKWGRWKRARGGDALPQDCGPDLIYQPIPDVDESDVERVIRRDFPEPQHAKVIELISTIDGPRTKLGILKLANRNTDEIAGLVDVAKQDYRDILANAEYPRCMQETNILRSDAATKAEIYAEDWAQYNQWLRAEQADTPKNE